MVMNQLGRLRVDLIRSRCNLLRITFAKELSESIASDLGFTTGSSGFKSFYETYTRNDEKVVITLNINKRPLQDRFYAIRLSYEILIRATPRVHIGIPSSRPKVSDAFARICDEKQVLFRCECLFSYKREEDTVPFALPIELKDYKMFDEIRGMRLVKLENEKILWENSLDLPDIDTMTHRVKFAIDSKCNIDLPNLLLKRAKEISSKTFN